MSSTASGTRAHTVPRFYLNGFTAAPLNSSHEPCVWVASLKTGQIKQRSPKNISIYRGAYDGPGGFSELDKTIEAHLAAIESAAAPAIRKFASLPMGSGAAVKPEVTRFLGWLACRTLPFQEAMERWINESPFMGEECFVEPPPPGFEKTSDRLHPVRMEDPETGDHCEVFSPAEADAFRRKGWRVVFQREDHLELMHWQAWYFQVRHFPRLSWARLRAPGGKFFITSDRPVAWFADGYAGAPPSWLRLPSALVIAPLTKKLALVGCQSTPDFIITPREVNRMTAFLASEWVAGPTKRVVEQALYDHQTISIPESEWLLGLDRL
jgi:hypothetical protein